MTAKKKYHHGNLRKQLIDTALEIIAADGLEKVSMRGLGSRIGVSRTAPYRHFKNKSQLLSAIAEEGYGRLAWVLNDVNTRASDDSLAKLMDAGIAYVEFAVSNPVHYRIMFGNEIRESDRPPSFLDAVGTAFNELLHAVQACQSDKMIKPFNPMIIANTLWALAHGISTLLIDGQVPMENAFRDLPVLLQEKEESARPDIRRIFESISPILFTGLLPDPPFRVWTDPLKL